MAVQASEVMTALDEFEAEVLETVRLDGPLTHSESGERTLCELFGFDNAQYDHLTRALRHLARYGFIKVEDGNRRGMTRSCQFKHTSGKTTYSAV